MVFNIGRECSILQKSTNNYCVTVLYNIIMSTLFHFFTSFLDLESTPNSGSSSASALQGGAFIYTYPEVKSFPNPTFAWRKHSSPMPETQRISFSKAGNLYIGNVDNHDLAPYTSTVQNTDAVQSFNRGPVNLQQVSCELLIHCTCTLVCIL